MTTVATKIHAAAASPRPIAVPAKCLARRLSAGRRTLIMRGIEFGAPGLAVLFGYLAAAERVTCL